MSSLYVYHHAIGSRLDDWKLHYSNFTARSNDSWELHYIMKQLMPNIAIRRVSNTSDLRIYAIWFRVQKCNFIRTLVYAFLFVCPTFSHGFYSYITEPYWRISPLLFVYSQGRPKNKSRVFYYGCPCIRTANHSILIGFFLFFFRTPLRGHRTKLNRTLPHVQKRASFENVFLQNLGSLSL